MQSIGDLLVEAELRTGTVKKKANKFGFIRDEKSRRDVFFHESELIDCSFNELQKGDQVVFLATLDKKGKLRAVDVGKEQGR